MESSPVWNHYYSVPKKMLSFIGQWPHQKKREKFFRTVLVITVQISVLIPQIGNYVQCGQDMHCILMSIPTSSMYVGILVKLLTCQFNRNKIEYLTKQLYIDWKKLEGPEENKIMETYAAKARLISLIYSLYYYICYPMFLCISLVPKILDKVLPLNESRPVLMPNECHYFVEDDTKYYYYILIHLLACSFVEIPTILAQDCVILTYIQHVCGVFAVAGYRLGNLTQNTDIENNNINNAYNKKIALSVDVHLRALQFAEFLENTFCVTLLVQMFIVVLALSVTLLQMAVQLDNVLETIRYAAFIVGQLIHVYCFSLQGQKLIDHSLQIHDQIYNGSWYKLPAKSQRMLLNVMRRSLQPNILSAGKIYIFSLRSFMAVLQSSVSYFTVLASFQ